MTQLILNFQNDSEATGGMMTSSSQVASRNYANHTQPQESDLAKKMNAIYGRRCSEQYGRLSQPTSWAKMVVDCLTGMEGWYSTRCVLTWKILGMKSRPVLYLRSVSMPRIEESEFGLLPTPRVGGQEGYDTRKERQGHEKASEGEPEKAFRPVVRGMAVAGRPTERCAIWSAAVCC